MGGDEKEKEYLRKGKKMDNKTTIVDCQTCLYMATHEHCDGCLRTEEDYKAMRWDGSPDPPYRYLHYKEGNWMDRVMQAWIDGTQNIVIGGQGEAEVNTKWTPQETSDSLHRVSEQCGYFTGHLTYNNHGDKKGCTMGTNLIFLRICTTEGEFRLEWSEGQLVCITPIGENLLGWSWDNVNPFRQTA